MTITPTISPMKSIGFFCCWSLAGFLLMAPARADFSVTLNGTTNYVYRGYTKSDNHPVAQINLDYEHDSGVFLGTWASMVDFGEDDKEFDDPAKVEITPYIGWSTALWKDWRFELFATRYIFAGKVFGDSVDYNEYFGLLHFRDLASFQFAWAPDLYDQGHNAFDYELTLRYPITDTFQISGRIGFNQAIEVLEYDYLYWDGGFSWFFKYASLDFRYVQSAYPSSKVRKVSWPYDPDKLDPTFVFTLSIGF